MSAEQLLSGASVLIAAVALAASTVLLVRQNKQMEHERNAAAILEAINRLTDPLSVLLQRHTDRDPTQGKVRSLIDVLHSWYLRKAVTAGMGPSPNSAARWYAGGCFL